MSSRGTRSEDDGQPAHRGVASGCSLRSFGRSPGRSTPPPASPIAVVAKDVTELATRRRERPTAVRSQRDEDSTPKVAVLSAEC